MTSLSTDAPHPILELRNIEAVYDDTILAVRGVSLSVREGAVVALLGANGAGKSTTLKAASGLLAAERGALKSGHVLYRGQDIGGLSAVERVRAGLAQVLEGRHCFKHLSVEENLRVGSYFTRPSRAQLAESLEMIYRYFPRLKLLRSKPAGLASGGEQQMVAIGRALIARPRLVLLDEPSMGLAPRVVEEIFGIVRDLNREQGTSFLLAEQNAAVALRYADHAVILESGAVAREGTAEALAARDDVRQFYLGVGDHGRQSFRDVKHYQRRQHA